MGVTRRKTKLLALIFTIVLAGIFVFAWNAEPVSSAGCTLYDSDTDRNCDSVQDCMRFARNLFKDEWGDASAICDTEAVRDDSTDTGKCGCHAEGHKCTVGYFKYSDTCDHQGSHLGVCVKSSDASGWGDQENAWQYCQICDASTGKIKIDRTTSSGKKQFKYYDWISDEDKYIDVANQKCYETCGAASACDTLTPGAICEIGDNDYGRCKASDGTTDGCMKCQPQCTSSNEGSTCQTKSGFGVCSGGKCKACSEGYYYSSSGAVCSVTCGGDTSCKGLTPNNWVTGISNLKCDDKCKPACTYDYYKNCDNNWFNGCEVDLRTDKTCGTACESAKACKSNEICFQQSCIAPSCAISWVDPKSNLKVGDPVQAKIVWNQQVGNPDFSRGYMRFELKPENLQVTTYETTYTNPKINVEFVHGTGWAYGLSWDIYDSYDRKIEPSRNTGEYREYVLEPKVGEKFKFKITIATTPSEEITQEIEFCTDCGTTTTSNLGFKCAGTSNCQSSSGKASILYRFSNGQTSEMISVSIAKVSFQSSYIKPSVQTVKVPAIESGMPFALNGNCTYDTKPTDTGGTFKGDCTSSLTFFPPFAGKLSMLSGYIYTSSSGVAVDCMMPSALDAGWKTCGTGSCQGTNNTIPASKVGQTITGKDLVCNSTTASCCIGGNQQSVCTVQGTCDSTKAVYCKDNIKCDGPTEGPGYCGYEATDKCGTSGKKCCTREEAQAYYGISAENYCGSGLACCVSGFCGTECKHCQVFVEPGDIAKGESTTVSIKYKSVPLPPGVSNVGDFNIYCEGKQVTDNIVKTPLCSGVSNDAGFNPSTTVCKAQCTYDDEITGVNVHQVYARARDNDAYECYTGEIYVYGTEFCTMEVDRENITQGESVTVKMNYGNFASAPLKITVDCQNGTTSGVSDLTVASDCTRNPGSCSATCVYPNVTRDRNDVEERAITAYFQTPKGTFTCSSADKTKPNPIVNIKRPSCGFGDCVGVWANDDHTVCSTGDERAKCCATSRKEGTCSESGYCVADRTCPAGGTCSDKQCGGTDPCGFKGGFCWGTQLNDYVREYCEASEKHPAESCNSPNLECCEIDSRCYDLNGCPKCAVVPSETSVFANQYFDVTVKMVGVDMVGVPPSVPLQCGGSAGTVSASCTLVKDLGGGLKDIECTGSCVYKTSSDAIYQLKTGQIIERGNVQLNCNQASVQVISSPECFVSLDKKEVVRGTNSSVKVSYGGLGSAPNTITLTCSDSSPAIASGCLTHPGSCSAVCTNTRSGESLPIRATIGTGTNQISCSADIKVVQPSCGKGECAGIWLDDTEQVCSSVNSGCCVSGNQRGTCSALGQCVAQAACETNEACIAGTCVGPDTCGKANLLCCDAANSPTGLPRYCASGLACCGSVEYSQGICRNQCSICDGVSLGDNTVCDPLTGKRACMSGFADCNNDIERGSSGNGCETDLTNDRRNCGGCGNTCGTVQDGFGEGHSWLDYNGNEKWDTANMVCQSSKCVNPEPVVRQSDCTPKDEWCVQYKARGPYDGYSEAGKGDVDSCACGCYAGTWAKTSQVLTDRGNTIPAGTYQCCGDDVDTSKGIGENWKGDCAECINGVWSGQEGDSDKDYCECMGGIWINELTGQHRCCGDDTNERWVDGQYLCSAELSGDKQNVESYRCAPTGDCPTISGATSTCGFGKEKVLGRSSYICTGSSWTPRPEVFLFPYSEAIAPLQTCLSTSQDGWSSIQLSLQACTKYLLGVYPTTRLSCTSSSPNECNLWICDSQLKGCELKTKVKTVRGESNLDSICTDSNHAVIPKIYGRTGQGGTTDSFAVVVEDISARVNHTAIMSYAITPEGRATCTRDGCFCNPQTHCISDDDCYGKNMFCDAITNVCTPKCSDYLGAPGSPNEGLCILQCGAAAECQGKAPYQTFNYGILDDLNISLRCNDECRVSEPARMQRIKVSTLAEDIELDDCGTKERPCSFSVESSGVSYMTFTTALDSQTSLPATMKLYIQTDEGMRLFDEWEAFALESSRTVNLNENIVGVRDVVLVADSQVNSATYRIMKVSFARKASVSIEMPNSQAMCVYRTATPSNTCEQQAMTMRVNFLDGRSLQPIAGRANCEIKVLGRTIGSVEGSTNELLQLNYKFDSSSPNGKGTITCRVTGEQKGGYYTFDQQIEKPFTVYGSISSALTTLPEEIVPGSSVSLAISKIEDDRGEMIASPSVCWQIACSGQTPKLLGCDKTKYAVPKDVGNCNGVLTAIISANGYDFYTRDYLVTLNQIAPFKYALFPSASAVQPTGGVPEFELTISNMGSSAVNMTVIPGPNVRMEIGGEWEAGEQYFFIGGQTLRKIKVQATVAAGAERTEMFYLELEDGNGNKRRAEGTIVVSQKDASLVSIEPSEIQFLETELDKTAEATFKIRNAGNIPDEYRLFVKGDAVDFVSIDTTSLLINPGEEKAVKVTIAPPIEGMYSFDICAVSEITSVQYCVTGIASIAARPISVEASPAELNIERGASKQVTFTITPGSLTTAVDLSLDRGTCEDWLSDDGWEGTLQMNKDEPVAKTITLSPPDVGKCVVKLTTVDPKSKTILTSVSVEAVHSQEDFRLLEELSSQVSVDLNYLEQSVKELQIGTDKRGTLGALQTRAIDALQKCNEALANRDYDSAKLYCENARTSAVSSSDLVLYVRGVETAEVPMAGMSPLVIVGLVLILGSGLYLILYRK